MKAKSQSLRPVPLAQESVAGGVYLFQLVLLPSILACGVNASSFRGSR